MTRYPLAAVLALRGREEAGARSALAHALAEEARRAVARAAAATRLAALAARVESAETEGGPLDGGAGALVVRARHAARLRAEQVALAEALLAADAALGRARADLDAARAVLAGARRSRRAVERHRDGWLATRRRARERREEAEADDRLSGTRAGP